MNTSKSRAAGCFSECPHFEAVKGTCNHELNQVLVGYLRDHPDRNCPIYDRWRATEMERLARAMER